METSKDLKITGRLLHPENNCNPVFIVRSLSCNAVQELQGNTQHKAPAQSAPQKTTRTKEKTHRKQKLKKENKLKKEKQNQTTKTQYTENTHTRRNRNKNCKKRGKKRINNRNTKTKI